MGMEVNTLTHVCEDIDECQELGSEACFNSACVNTIGSYECDCPPGTILDHTRRLCIGEQNILPKTTSPSLILSSLHSAPIPHSYP
jgi:hypothetical protein